LGLAGLAESALLYTPAFSALTRWYGPHWVRALTTLSLVAGLSSTVFAPLTAALASRLDWRTTYVVLALLLGVITFPMHVRYLAPPWSREEARHWRRHEPAHQRAVVRSRAFALLVLAMTLAAFGMYAATVNLVPLLTGRGVAMAIAATALGLCGAGQVLGRLGYAPLARWTGPRLRTMAVMAIGAATVALLGALPGPTSVLVGAAVAAGCARGVLTLVQATAISDRWGTQHFASLNGLFSVPTTTAMAVAPAGGALFANWLGGYPRAFYILSGVVLAGVAAAAATDVDSSVVRPQLGNR